jgi:tetratricopeptide (TPR) repeat protein
MPAEVALRQPVDQVRREAIPVAARHARIVTAGLLLAAILAAGAPGSVSAQSPLAAEVKTLAVRYHENPARLDQVRAGLEEALKSDSHVDNLVALARVSFIWGDARARTDEEKLAAYDRGREVAQRAIELEPKNAAAHFWFAANSGRWGQTKGVMRSLFLVPTIKREIQTVIDLDPKFTSVYALAGNVYYVLPGLAGGDLDLSEEMFRKGLAQDPKFTGMRVGLAKTLIKKNRVADARRELQAVLDERAPTNPADWTVRDSKEARQLLESIKGK